MARPGTPSWPQSIPTIPFGSADAPEGEHLYREADAAQRSAASAMRQVHTSLQSCVKISLTAGGAQRTVETGRMAAPQGPCPLPGGARLAGIESRDDDPPAAWQCGMEGGHGTRARRFPRKTQAEASIGKTDRASSGGRGSNVSRSGIEGGTAARDAVTPAVGA